MTFMTFRRRNSRRACRPSCLRGHPPESDGRLPTSVSSGSPPSDSRFSWAERPNNPAWRIRSSLGASESNQTAIGERVLKVHRLSSCWSSATIAAAAISAVSSR